MDGRTDGVWGLRRKQALVHLDMKISDWPLAGFSRRCDLIEDIYLKCSRYAGGCWLEEQLWNCGMPGIACTGSIAANAELKFYPKSRHTAEKYRVLMSPGRLWYGTWINVAQLLPKTHMLLPNICPKLMGTDHEREKGKGRNCQ